jgi:Lon-like ATP-dependent protease
MLCYLFHAKKATTSSFPSSAMIRATRSTSSRIRSSDKYIRMGLPKGFFWSANNSNGDDGEDNDGRGRKKEAGEVKNGETKTATSGDTTADVTTSSHKEEGVYKNKRRSSSTSTTNRFTRRIQEHYPHNNDILWTSSGFSGSSTTSSSNGSSSSSSTFLPSYQGYGESSPRFPHLIGLPVIHRPIFPGVPANITITDKATIDAIEQLTSKGPAYLGVFLRKSGADGLLEGGLGVIEHPEIITDINDIYSVGTFAQIHRFQREMGIDPSTLHATTFGSSNLAVRRRAHNDNKPTTHNNHHKGSKHIHRIQQEEDEKDMDHDTHEQQQEEEEQNDDDNHEDQREGATAASLLLLAHRRIDLISIDNYGPPIDITVKHWDRLDYNPRGDTATEDMIKALTNEVLSSIREIAATSPMFREQISRFPLRVDTSNPYALADFAASISMGSPAEHQAILEERDAEKRLHKALLLLSKEREVSKLQQEISRKVEEKMTDQQRRYLLMEQLKSIKKELGMEVDDKEALIDKYKKKVQNKAMVVPDDVMKVIDSELEKLSTLEKNSSEFNVTRSYLDWLTDIPWGVTSDETFDIVRARKILDRDHYGLDQVKDTILQFIAVGKLKGSVSQGSILILWGPPGTGKTSVAQSVAEALGRKFFRFSVGGLGDVSEIKGHRRTYVGAMPGKFIQGLKSAGTCNPLILIDEIDKLGRDFRGDPASALLEVLVRFALQDVGGISFYFIGRQTTTF